MIENQGKGPKSKCTSSQCAFGVDWLERKCDCQINNFNLDCKGKTKKKPSLLHRKSKTRRGKDSNIERVKKQIGEKKGKS